MTTMLQKAIDELQKLPASDQDTMAALILAELADERQWDETFANSQELLSQMAAKAKEDIATGQVTRKGIDEL